MRLTAAPRDFARCYTAGATRHPDAWQDSQRYESTRSKVHRKRLPCCEAGVTRTLSLEPDVSSVSPLKAGFCGGGSMMAIVAIMAFFSSNSAGRTHGARHALCLTVERQDNDGKDCRFLPSMMAIFAIMAFFVSVLHRRGLSN